MSPAQTPDPEGLTESIRELSEDVLACAQSADCVYMPSARTGSAAHLANAVVIHHHEEERA